MSEDQQNQSAPPPPTPADSDPRDVAATPSPLDTALRGIRGTMLSNPAYPIQPPIVSLRRIDKITTYEVMEGDLEDLDKASRSEKHALAFATLCAGGLISTVASWLGCPDAGPTKFAAYLAATLVLTLGCLNFAVAWLRERGRKTRLLDRIRSQTVVIEEARIGR